MVLETANTHSKYAGKRARGLEKAYRWNAGRSEVIRKNGDGGREKDKAVAARAREKAYRVRTKEERKDAASERPRTAQKPKSALPRCVLHSEIR